MKKYGFALIGCGAIAGIHSQAIKEMSQAELVGVYDTFSESAERFAKEKNCKAFESMEALLSDSGVDIVCICTPSGLHAELAMRVAKAKKHIVVEKPMAITKESLAELIEVIRENQVKCAVIAQLRFTSAVQKIKKAIADEKLGTIRTVDFTMRYLRTQEYYDKGAWRGTWAMDGGGALMNQGIHGIDLVQYLVGGVASVYAQCRTLARNIEVRDIIGERSKREVVCFHVRVASLNLNNFPHLGKRFSVSNKGHSRVSAVSGSGFAGHLQSNTGNRTALLDQRACTVFVFQDMKCFGHFKVDADVSSNRRSAEGDSTFDFDAQAFAKLNQLTGKHSAFCFIRDFCAGTCWDVNHAGV